MSLINSIQYQKEKLQKLHQYDNKKLAYILKNKDLLYPYQKTLLENELNSYQMRSMINTINCNVLKVWKDKHIWELDFETTSDSEDNDSDDEENDLRTKHF